MADLEAVLADVSYLMAMEKSRVQGGNTGGIGKKKLNLPDPSVRTVIVKHLIARNKLNFERLLHQRMGYELLCDFCCPDGASHSEKCEPRYMLFSFYRRIVVYEKTFMEEERGSLAHEIYDQHIMPSLLVRDETALEPIHDAVAERIRKENFPLSLFNPFKPGLETKLKALVWEDFLKSQQFVAFCQWKYVQLNQRVTIEHFTIHRIIGRGGFGEVFGCCKSDTGQMFALKCLCKKRLKRRHHESSAVHERNMLAKVHSPFIVCLSYAFQTNERLFLAVDLCNGGDLHYHLTQHGPFTEDEVKFYVAEISLGLDHLHSRSIVYRDLKPSNILLTDDGHCRISDLGLAVNFAEHRVRDSVGTHGYMAPEVLKKVQYTFTPDWFSLGCMLVRMSSQHGAFTFGSSNKKEIDSNCMLKDPYLPPDATPEYRDFLLGLLKKDPAERLACKGAGLDELRRHAFMTTLNWGQAMSVQLVPPIIPPSDEVNAAEATSIGQFSEDDVKSIKLSEEDQRHYRHFDCIVSDRWQTEVCDSVFKQLTADAIRSFQRRITKLKSKVYDPQSSDDNTDCMIDGYLMRQTSVIHAWRRNYFFLFPNRLEWSEDHMVLPCGLILADSFRTIAESTHKNQKCLRLRYADKTEVKELVIKADSDMELDMWHTELKVAISRAQAMLKSVPTKVQSAQSNSGMGEFRALRKALSTSAFTFGLASSSSISNSVPGGAAAAAATLSSPDAISAGTSRSSRKGSLGSPVSDLILEDAMCKPGDGSKPSSPRPSTPTVKITDDGGGK
eukprot:scpid27601/ scgid9095/ Beta-adrenergic receptor kinase 1; G-protein-coupled receptor kinase 2